MHHRRDGEYHLNAELRRVASKVLVRGPMYSEDIESDKCICPVTPYHSPKIEIGK